jgi:hypothetical protein
MQLDDQIFLNAPRMQALRDQALATQAEDDKKKFLAALVREISKALNDVTVSNLSDGVNVNNLDEIKASLRNELNKANKPITDILTKLNMSTQEQTKFLKDVENKAENEVDDSVQTVVVKRLKDRTEVTNLSDIVFPSEISINNLASLEEYLKELGNKISALKLDVNVEAPNVTVQPTPVHIPETVLNIPATDLEPIISALEKNLKLLRTNNKSNPLAVRLTDGSEWVKELKALNRQAAQTTQFMSDVSYIRNAAGLRINPATSEDVGGANSIGDGSKTVTTAGTRVQLSATSVPCRYVIVTALVTNTDTIWLGSSTVAAGRGRPLVSLQAEKLDINNLNKVYIDSVVNGEGCSYVYVA